MRKLWRRMVSVVLVLVMVGMSLSGYIPPVRTAKAAAANMAALSLPVKVLPDIETAEGMTYVGFVTGQSELPESGLYTLTIQRTGDVSRISYAIVETVDVSAVYGVDYRIEDDRWDTEVRETSGTLLELSGDELNRQAAAAAMNGIMDNILGSATAPETTLTADDIDDSSSLAALKARQSGQSVRETYESEFTPLTESLMSDLDTDVADYVETSSATRIAFAPGETEQTIIFRVLEDTESEGQEMFNLLLSGGDDTTAAIEAARSLSFVIEDDEPVEHSTVTFSRETYQADDGVVKVTLTRDIAPYSYVTVGVRAAGSDYSWVSADAVFQPYQTTTVAELYVPVGGDEEKTFPIELFDLKGGDPGEITTAQVIIPAGSDDDETDDESDPDDSYLELFGSDHPQIADKANTVDIDKRYSISYPNGGNVGYLMDGNNVAGMYIIPSDINAFSIAETGDRGKFKHEIITDSGQNVLHLAYDSWYYKDRGTSKAVYYVDNPFRYRLVMVDMRTDSKYNYAARMGMEFGDAHVTLSDNYVGGTNGRKLRLATPMFNVRNDGVYFPHNFVYNRACIGLYTERVTKDLANPEAWIYGIVLMYRKYEIAVEQPDCMIYRSGYLDEHGSPIVEERRPAKMTVIDSTRYTGQAIHMMEAPADGNEAVYGELIGYTITPQNGTEFFFATNSTTITLNDDLIRQIDNHTQALQRQNCVQDGGGDLAYTKVTFKPVYKYKDVQMILETPDGLPEGAEYHYLDKDLEAQRKSGKPSLDVFHVGDKLNLTMTTDEDGYYLQKCWRAQYLNPGDTAYDQNRSGELPLENGIPPKPVIVYTKCVCRGIFSHTQNHIQIKLDEDAQKYFVVENTVPQSYLSEYYMKGQCVLNTAEATGVKGEARTYSTEVVSGRAYTITLTFSDDNDGTWRPVIIFPKTGQKVNGFAADFLAGNDAEHNVVIVTAEKFDPNKYQFFSVDGSVVYSAYALRPGSERLTSSPAMKASVIGGGGYQRLWKKIYDDSVWDVKEQILCETAVRSGAVTGDDGTFRLNGIRAMNGDTISVRVDNNDVQQVVYITLNSEFSEKREFNEMCPSEESVDEDGCFINEMKLVEVTHAVNAGSKAISMPIRTFYSPYVSGVFFQYGKHTIDTQGNQLPIYNDELFLSIYVEPNEGNISTVLVTKIGRNGNKIERKALRDPSYTNVWGVIFTGSEMADGDRFYVQLVATPKGGKHEITYTSLDAGLEMYTPKEEEKVQYLHYTMPNPYKDLPVLGNMAGSLDSGKLSWRTIYADDDNRGTSDYAQLITVAISTEDIEKGQLKLDAFKSGKAIRKGENWQSLIDSKDDKFSDYLDANEQAQFADEYRVINPEATDEDVKNYFNNNPAEQANYREQLMKGAKKDALSKMGELDLECAVNVLLQLEYVYDVEDRTHYYSGGQYIIAFNITANKTWYWTVYGVPVFIDVTGKINLQFDGRYVTEQGVTTAKKMGEYDDLTEAVKSEWPYFQYGMTLQLQPGVGICGILSARGVITFNFVGRVNVGDSTLAGTMGTMSGGVGVDLLLFSFDYEIGSIGWKKGLFEQKSSIALRGSRENSENMVLRTFNAGEERSNMRIESTLLPTAKKTLINGSVEYARPELADLGDGRLMLLFLRNDPNGDRSDANASALVYTIRDADGEWPMDAQHNIAATVIESDEGADSTPAILRIGSKVYLAWTSAEQAVSDENGTLTLQSAKEALRSTNIHMAIYDVEKDSMYGPIQVTDDSFVNSHPILTAEDGKVSIYYFKRDISTAGEITDLVGLSNNYSTWARMVYDPDEGAFIDVLPGRTNPKEELLYIRHPSVTDPMVADLDVMDFYYTDQSGETKEYRIYSYSVDRDCDPETADDRELWVQVTNVTDGRNYYPMPVDARRENILDPKLTKLGDDVYLTWLSDNTTFNAISANEIFSGLDIEDGGSGITGLERVRALTKEQIAVSGWYKLPIEEVGGLSKETREQFNTLSRLARCDLKNMQKDFGCYNSAGIHEGRSLADHQLVAGADGNLYLFWTGQDSNNTENATGRELYGAALCTDGEVAAVEWSNGIQLTNYGKVIDELTVCVASDKDAVMVANVYSQRITEDGHVEYSSHELSEIDFVAGNSLEFTRGTIALSDMYPVEGEKVEAVLEIENNGLLPAARYDLTVNGEKTTVEDEMIKAGETRSFVREFSAGANGELNVSAEVAELNGIQPLAVREYGGNKVSVSTRSGAVMEFGTAKMYDYREDILPKVDASINDNAGLYSEDEFNRYINKILEPLAPEVQAILRATDSRDDYADYVVCVPVTNIGNRDGKNLKASAVVVTEQRKDVDPAVYGSSSITEVVHGETVGTGEIALVPVKTVNEDGEVETQTVYAVIPLHNLDLQRDMNEMGIIRIDVQFMLDGQELRDSRLVSYHVMNNVELTVNEGNDIIQIQKGEAFRANVEAFPWNSIKELAFTAEDNSVVAVSPDGRLVGIKPGTTVLTIEDTSTRNLSRQVTVVVSEKEHSTEDQPELSPSLTPTVTLTPVATVTPTPELTSMPEPDEPSSTPTVTPTVTPMVTPTVTPTVTPKPEDMPTTGDTAPIKWWMVLAAVSLCAIGAFAVGKKKRRR